MNRLHQAYQVMGLETGASLKEVTRRYKFLAFMWHPDRVQSDEKKSEAEEELKKINDSFDLLKKHFQNGHIEAHNCACQPNNDDSASYFRRYAEQAANAEKDPDVQRRRRHAAEAFAKYMSGSAESQPCSNKPQATQRSVKPETVSWNPLIAILSLVVTLACLAKDPSTRSEFQSQPNTEHVRQEPVSKPILTPIKLNTLTPYQHVSPLTTEHPLSVWRLKQEKQKEQDVYFARLEIDRARKAIDRSRDNLAQIDLKLSYPLLDPAQKEKLIVMRQFQQQNLRQAQDELDAAQRKVHLAQDLATSILVSSPAPLPAILQNGF